MDKLFIILLMLFLHIVDDYYLQGILASMKQRSWWKDSAPDKQYKNDYLMALAMHGFSWTFMVMLPIAAYMDFSLCVDFYIWFFTNWFIHTTIDHMKANVRSINLIQDQTAHIVQIIVTAVHFLYA